MRRQMFLITLILFTAIGWAQSSNNLLVGRWVMKDGGVTITYTFTKDTFTAIREKDLGEFGKQSWTTKGRYVISQDKVILISDDGQKKKYAYSIEGNKLTIDGVCYTRENAGDILEFPSPKKGGTLSSGNKSPGLIGEWVTADGKFFLAFMPDGTGTFNDRECFYELKGNRLILRDKKNSDKRAEYSTSFKDHNTLIMTSSHGDKYYLSRIVGEVEEEKLLSQTKPSVAKKGGLPSSLKKWKKFVDSNGIVSIRYPDRWTTKTRQEVDIVMGTGIRIWQYLFSDNGDKFYVDIESEIVRENEIGNAISEMVPSKDILSGFNPIKEERVNISGYVVDSTYFNIENGKSRLIAFSSNGLGIVLRIDIENEEGVFAQYAEIVDLILESVEISLNPNSEVQNMLIGNWVGEWFSKNAGGTVNYSFNTDQTYVRKSDVGVSVTGRDQYGDVDWIGTGTSEGEAEYGKFFLWGNVLVQVSQTGKVSSGEIITFNGDTTSFVIGETLFKKR